MKGDFHIHSVHSDGVHTIDYLCQVYKALGYSHLAFTDHYTIPFSLRDDNLLKMKKELYNIDIILGSEQVALVNGEYVHILCYFNKNKDLSPKILELLDGQANFTKAFNNRIKLLMKKQNVDIPDIDYSTIDATSYMPILFEVCKRTGKTIKDTRKEFFTHMNNLDFTGLTRLDFEELVEEVHKSKGLLVLAHPMQYQEETVYQCIKSIDGLECIYGGYTEQQISKLKELAKKHNLLITAGSDFHSNKIIDPKHGDLGSVSLDGEHLYNFLKRLKGEDFKLDKEDFLKENNKHKIHSSPQKDDIKEWLTEEGFHLEKNICGEQYFVTHNNLTSLINLEDFNLNGVAFKLNSSKRQSLSILDKFQVPHTEVIDLSENLNLATAEVMQFLDKHKICVLRGDKGTCGNNTFIIEKNDSITSALNQILQNKNRAFLSPYYNSAFEYRVCMLKNKAHLVIRKEMNVHNKKHNISQGAKSFIEKDINLIKQLEGISLSVCKIFNLNFAAIDILQTSEGFLVVEFGVVNLKRFARNNEECKLAAKSLFIEACKAKLLEDNK